MLVLLSVSLVSAESDIEKSVRIGRLNFGTTTAHDEIADFARKNDLSKLACVNCKKVGGLYIDGIVLGCTKCNIHSLKSEYKPQTQFCKGQEVWSTVYGRGVVKQPIISLGYKEYIIPVDFGGNIGVWNYTTDGRDQTSQPQTLFPITTKQVIYNLDKLFPEPKKSQHLTADQRIEELINKILSECKQVDASTSTCRNIPRKIKCELIIGEEEKSEKKQERLSVGELIGTETAGFTLSDWTSSYHCVVCGESLTTVYRNAVWFCFKCKKYFNIEKGK